MSAERNKSLANTSVLSGNASHAFSKFFSHDHWNWKQCHILQKHTRRVRPNTFAYTGVEHIHELGTIFFLTARNSVHSSPISRSKKWTRTIATTSVSTVLSRAYSIPFWVAWLRWTNILVSASFWLQGNKGDKSFSKSEVTTDSLVQEML